MSYAGMGQILDMLASGGPVLTPGSGIPPGLRYGTIVGGSSRPTAIGPTPARVSTSASTAISNVTIAKANVDRLFRTYQTTPYMDAMKRNNTRRALIAAERNLVALLQFVRPATEQERLRLRAVAASALASSQLRQRCFSSGAAGCGGFLMNEPNGPTKTNDEFVAATRPLDTFIRTRHTRSIRPRPVARTVVIVAGQPVPVIPPANTAAIAATAQEGVVVAAAKLATDVQVAQTVTNAETKAAADKVVVAQTGADAAAKAAADAATAATAAAATAATATQVAQSSGTPAAVQTAQVAAQVAEEAQVVAEQATVAATEIATVADVARSELETVATVTNDVPAQNAATDATMTVAVATTGLGPLGVSWKVWGIGAAAVIGGYLMMGRKTTPNRRRHVRRNRRTTR